MKIPTLTFVLLLGLVTSTYGQASEDEKSESPVWTEDDRKYLLDNLTRSKKELVEEVQNLTEDQWNFKENPDRWSINQIVEHLAIWEVILLNEVSTSLQMGPFPQIKKYKDDGFFINMNSMDSIQNTTDYTKPFTYSVPLGNNKGRNNLTWFLTMTNEVIDFVNEEERNLRLHYVNFGPNIHQRLIMFYGHVDKHIVQIRKVKEDGNYPKE